MPPYFLVLINYTLILINMQIFFCILVTESLYPNYNTGENKREMDSLNFIQRERLS